jgi:hypothetical protein
MIVVVDGAYFKTKVHHIIEYVLPGQNCSFFSLILSLAFSHRSRDRQYRLGLLAKNSYRNARAGRDVH